MHAIQLSTWCSLQGVAVHKGKIYYSDPDYERIYEVDENGENENVLRSNLQGVSVIKTYSERHSSGKFKLNLGNIQFV